MPPSRNAQAAPAAPVKLKRQNTVSAVASTVGNVTYNAGMLPILLVGKLKKMTLKAATDTGLIAAPARVSPKQRLADERAARKVFADADTNGDGVLSFQEMKDALKSLAEQMGHKISASEVFAAFESADEDSNSLVSVDEFISFYARWKQEQAAKPLQPAAGERKSRLAPRSSAAPSTVNVEQEKAARDAAGLASRKRAIALVKEVEPISYGEFGHNALSDLFVQASSGSIDGIHAQGAHHGTALGLDMNKTVGEQEDEGRIDKIRMPLDKFRVFCSLIGIDGQILQANFFRNCRPGKDKLLTFQELLRGIAPLTKGTAQDRSAFHFLLYDENGNGMIEPREIFRLQQDLKPDSTIEADLIRFAKVSNDLPVGAKGLTFDTYEAEVKKHGECPFHDELKQLLMAGEREGGR